jgi:CitB-like protein
VQQRVELIREGARQMAICNACRYCEGYCAVFPAMERRLDFAAGDMNYLANLCHNCGECLYACQYAPPHEFGVDIPRTLAKIRAESYEQYAWPSAFASAYRGNGFKTAVVLVLAVIGVLLAAFMVLGKAPLFTAVPGGNFYAVVPHGVMAWSFGLVGLFVVLALGIGVARFWRDAGESFGALAQPGPVLDHAAQPPPGRRALHRRRGTAHAPAAHFPSLHPVRVPALLRRDLRRHGLPLWFRLDRALCVYEPAGDPRHGRRHRAGDRAYRALRARPLARPGAR